DFAHSSGFSSWEEMCRMVASVDISTPDRMERFKAWQEGDGTKGMLEFLIARNNTSSSEESSSPTEQTAYADEAEDKFAGLDADQEITVHVPGRPGTLKRL